VFDKATYDANRKAGKRGQGVLEITATAVTEWTKTEWTKSGKITRAIKVVRSQGLNRAKNRGGRISATKFSIFNTTFWAKQKAERAQRVLRHETIAKEHSERRKKERANVGTK
jgi:hypothetical protein